MTCWVPFFLLCAISFGQSLTPRELFYSSIKKPATKQAEPQPAVKRASAPAAVLRKNQESAQAKAPVVKQPAQSQIAAAAYSPLGLRYSLLHSSDGPPYVEVDSDTVFKSGDKLRVTAQANDPAHLYVISRGSSGNWKVLFPSAEVGGGDNKVAAMQTLEIPPGGRFYFDENPGEEKLFIVLSRRPVEDLEALIYDLGKSPHENTKEKNIMLAQQIAPIDDALVGRLRSGVQARDLVFEKVSEKTMGDRKEKALYVVNTKNSPDARLVVDLTLKHK